MYMPERQQFVSRLLQTLGQPSAAETLRLRQLSSRILVSLLLTTAGQVHMPGEKPTIVVSCRGCLMCLRCSWCSWWSLLDVCVAVCAACPGM
jgi:hypothetical protein